MISTKTKFYIIPNPNLELRKRNYYLIWNHFIDEDQNMKKYHYKSNELLKKFGLILSEKTIKFSFVNAWKILCSFLKKLH